MSFFRRSRAEDAVDRYNHTWSVLLMLLLFLVMWLSSLRPDLQPSVSVHARSSQSMQVPNTYQAICWCPSEFVPSMVSYANAVCAGALNAAIRQDKEMSSTAAKIWELEVDLPVPISSYKYAKLLHVTSGGANDNTSLKLGKMEEEAKDLNKDISYFAYMKTPVVLFLFAVFLKLPHVLWILLSSCCGLNVDSTLETAVRGQALDQDSGKKLNKELARAVSEEVKRSRIVTCCLYLLLKILMVAVAIGELVVIYGTVQEHHKLKDEQESFKSGTAATATSEVRDFSKAPLLCDFSIRKLQNIQTWSVQCAFSKMETTSETNSSSNILDLVGTVHVVVGVYLLVLTIINILNLASWLARLVVSPCRVSVGSGSELPLDGHLLLHMARLNAGPLIIQDIVGGGLGGARKAQEEAELVKLQE